MRLSWHRGGLLLEPESSRESSALMRLMEALVLLGITERPPEPGPDAGPDPKPEKE
jgi:hypothetical protein